MAPWTTDDIPDQHGRTALVTGASDGLGLLTATALAARGATVLLGCRNREKGERAQAKVAEAAIGPAPALVRLDLMDLESVRTTAETLNASLTRLDLLVNNAGIMAVPLLYTAEGLESQFATNHLGHYALTGRLLPALLRAPAPRVISLASGAHRIGRPRWDDPNCKESRYRPWPAYGRSKLANLQFMYELGRRAAAAGVPLVSAAAHPGYAATNLAAASTGAGGHRLRRAASASASSPRAWKWACSPSSTRRRCPTWRPATISAPTAWASSGATRPAWGRPSTPATRRRRPACGRSRPSSPASPTTGTAPAPARQPDIY
jgi:NAD(P)-dependent dehydrogenase (short-subunit alcohol dehydrogenase family)